MVVTQARQIHEGPDFDPIAGVSLALYAAISRDLTTADHDPARGVEVAAQHGVGATAWATAVEGWNVRVEANPAVARDFNRLYWGP